jgi:hypothetical protein
MPRHRSRDSDCNLIVIQAAYNDRRDYSAGGLVSPSRIVIPQLQITERGPL